MLAFFVVFSILSLLALVAGFVWVLVSKGETSHRSGEDVGAELISDRMENDDEWSLIEKSAFKGQAKVVSREANISFKEIKIQLKSGNWREVFPALLALVGFLGLLTFGSLALFFTLEDKLVGGLIATVAIFSVARILFQMARA